MNKTGDILANGPNLRSISAACIKAVERWALAEHSRRRRKTSNRVPLGIAVEKIALRHVAHVNECICFGDARRKRTVCMAVLVVAESMRRECQIGASQIVLVFPITIERLGRDAGAEPAGRCAEDAG